MWMMWITCGYLRMIVLADCMRLKEPFNGCGLTAKQMLSYLYNVAGAHCNQQIAVFALL